MPRVHGAALAGAAIFAGVVSSSPVAALAIGRAGLPFPLAVAVLFAAAYGVIALLGRAESAAGSASSGDGGLFGDWGDGCADGADSGADGGGGDGGGGD